MAESFTMPERIIWGEDAFLAAEPVLKSMGKKAFIITDPMMKNLGNTKLVETVLQDNGVSSIVFDQIIGEPTDQMIKEALQSYKESNCDYLIGLGGGSAIDSMKAVGALVKSKKKLTDYLEAPIEHSVPPMVAIPTTAGTGSEATQFMIITDTHHDVKMLLKGPALLPDLAIIDPRFTLTTPPRITAFTGLDALCHCIEAYTSRKAQLLSNIFALSAVKRIMSWLPVAFMEGRNLKARNEMALAAFEAGVAFSNSSVTIIHGMSRPIGALYHIPHGLSNAILMKECLEYALPKAVDRFAILAKRIEVASENDEDQVAAEAFLTHVIRLIDQLEIPTILDCGVNKEEFLTQIPKMAKDALFSGSPQNTRRIPTQEDIEAIYRKIIVNKGEKNV